VSRPCAADNRSKMQDRLLKKSCLEVERELLAKADLKTLISGNRSAVRSLDVLNTVKKEVSVVLLYEAKLTIN
jgi:hypothetical protein